MRLPLVPSHVRWQGFRLEFNWFDDLDDRLSFHPVRRLLFYIRLSLTMPLIISTYTFLFGLSRYTGFPKHVF